MIDSMSNLVKWGGSTYQRKRTVLGHGTGREMQFDDKSAGLGW